MTDTPRPRCDNCGEPMVSHCSRHVVPCCPRYPQHEAADSQAVRLDVVEELSAAQARCLRAYIAHGRYRPAAASLGIAEQTLKNHLRDARIRWGVRSSVQLAYRLGRESK